MCISPWDTPEVIHDNSIVRKYDLSVYLKISRSEVEKIHRYLKKKIRIMSVLDELPCIFVRFSIIIIVLYYNKSI